MKNHYRQGDVLIVEVAELPSGLTPIEREASRVILAHGELTGHAHAIRDKHALLQSTAAGRTFLTILDNPASLGHEEHSTVTIPPGLYRTVRQTEYSPQALRNVAD